MRASALIWSSHLTNTPRVSMQLMHLQDWLPTLVQGALGAELPPELSERLDGRNVWTSLNEPNISTYKELLLFIDVEREIYSLRYDNWKINIGS
jgi:arylsulfatase A-like enzyme